MDKLRNFIEDNRAEFEKGHLISGHKKRFLKKIVKTEKGRDVYFIPQWAKLAIASAVVLFLVIPVFINNRMSQMETGEYYSQILNEQSSYIENLASELEPEQQYGVESALRQLRDDEIPLSQQLPSSMSRKERREIIKGYYSTKLDGAERLKEYIQTLVEE